MLSEASFNVSIYIGFLLTIKQIMSSLSQTKKKRVHDFCAPGVVLIGRGVLPD
jgi:uncharacterized membrane protein